MSKYKKLRLLEYLIIIVIALSIVVIYLVFTKLSKEKPLLSNTEEIVNYKQTKYFEYNAPIETAVAYSVPYFDRIIPENSLFLITLTSVDNYIDDYRETIEIQYNWDLSEAEKNDIANYCNSYDKIENLYSIRCKMKNNKIQINNLYHISKLLSQDLVIKDMSIHLPVDRKTKTSDYLYNLDRNGIDFRQIED